MHKVKALQPLLLCVSVPTPAPKVCPCARGSVLLSPWGRVHESCKDLSVPAPLLQGGTEESPPVIAGPTGTAWAWGQLSALRGSPAPIWGSAGLLHLLAAVSWCPLRSRPLPHNHGAILEKQLLMEKKETEVP